MDISTRVGVGGVGLATIVAILVAVIPHLSVLVWGPLLGLSAAMFAWGLWPLARSLSLGHIGLWNVPMATACRIAYEKSETDLVGMAAYRMGASHDDTLGYFFHSFCLQGLPIYGKKLPSTKSRIIPPKELKRLFPDVGLRTVSFLGERGKPVYSDITIRRWDLWRAIKYLRKVGKET
jgi:hypothetical protein